MPQQDAFDEHLTIGENLLFAAAIRAPHLSRRDRSRRLEAKLIELGLGERRDAVVGSPERKLLSGGERKRLNIGLDMFGMSDVYLFDEPTSGLSSKDSEHVMEIIRGLSHNKIVIVTIHQPSSKLFQMFHKAILLDKGGRLVFFGTPSDMLRYFAEAEHQHQFGAELGACPSCGTTRPEFIFDVLETPLRDLSGVIISVGVAPVLALLIATILRYSDSGKYDFASAYHIPTYLFLSLIVAMFLGLTNSADDIIRDRVVLQRERNLNVRLPYYVISKTLTLGVFALIQCVLFVLIGNYVLQIRGMFWIYLAIIFMTAMGGVSLGLVVSSLVADPKTAANIVPLVLIPQIIMGGALIKYEDMNRNRAHVEAFTQWFSEHPSTEQGKKLSSRLQVPFVCQFIAMRWSYEEMVVAQAKLNPLTRRQERVNREMQRIVEQKNQNPENTRRLNDLKEILAMLSGLEAKTPDQLDRYLDLIDEILNGKRPFDRELFKDAIGPVTAEQLYVNQKISDLISNAEMEQSDYRRGGKLNVFFGEEKRYFGRFAVDLFVFNTIVLIGSTLGLLGILHWILRRQLEVRRT